MLYKGKTAVRSVKKIFDIILILCALVSCNNVKINNPPKLIGENVLDLQSQLGTVYYQGNTPETRFIAVHGNRSNVLVVEIDRDTDKIIDSFYSPYVKREQLKNYLGCSYNEIITKVGKPYEKRKIVNEKDIDYLCIYFQKDSNIFRKMKCPVSSYVLVLNFNAESELISVDELYWTRP